MYPNTECPHDCYKPGDCDGSCTHPTAANPANAFRNMFAILYNLDDSELRFLDPRQRLQFFDNPLRTILQLDDTRLDALYALVQSKQPERYKEAM